MRVSNQKADDRLTSDTIPPRRRWSAKVRRVSFALMAVAFALTSPSLVIWAYFTVVHAATVIQDRYHFASVPFIGILAASLAARNPRPSEHLS